MNPIALYGPTGTWDADDFVARVTRNPHRPRAKRADEVLVCSTWERGTALPVGFRQVFLVESHMQRSGAAVQGCPIALPASLGHLADGDVVHVRPRAGHLSVVYRRNSASNSLFVTARCNSRCVMCAQPPTEHADDELRMVAMDALPLISEDTLELGITGGEPTLLGAGLIDIVRRCRALLPRTRVHLLSNGRLFRYARYARALSDVGHPALTVGVPLFSDLPECHDFVAQSAGAFDQTIGGLLNLARFRVAVELRVVVQSANVDRLPELARFVASNLPFVRQVSLMALEPVGFARANSASVWVSPSEYSAALATAVDLLAAAHLCPVVMNHPLCALEESARRYAVQSISDYKNVYPPECDTCEERSRCCGFFASADARHRVECRPLAGVLMSAV